MVMPVKPDATPTLAGYRAARSLLEELSGVQGLFCETDEFALGAIAALRDDGISVPEDISVVGFDDLPGLASGLTTIKQSFSDLADACLTLIEEAKTKNGARNITLPVEMIVRET